MKFNLGKNGGLLVEIYFEGLSCECKLYNHLKEKKIFEGKLGQVYVNTFENVAFVGLGKKDELDLNEVRTAFFNLAKELEKNNVNEISLTVEKIDGVCMAGFTSAVVEGLKQAEYKFDRFHTDRKEAFELTVNYTLNIEEEKLPVIQKAIDETQSLIDSVFITRDLVNLPSNYIYPETLANKAKELLEKVGVKVTIYGEEEAIKMGLNAFLAVGSGSDREPKFIVMEYSNDPTSNEKLALVGKGITYDSGGYSLKPSDGMKTMFDDMGGAGTVIGTIHAIAKSKLKANVVGVVGACENALSGHSYKPGDIVTSFSGKTIEIDNTDAEGRVTLADSVYYASTVMKATKVIDLATLTGACLVAFGEVYTGAVTNNQEFFNQVVSAAKLSGEKIWQLPTDKEFAKLNKSRVADIKNTGGRMGGTITAGMFVGEFNNNLPWIHLDIAGTAFLSKAYSYLPVGATGIHVKTLYNLVKGL